MDKVVNYIPARAQGEIHFTDADKTIVSSAVTSAGEMMSRRQMTHHVSSDDTAISHAKASLLYSVAYAFAAALITGAICLVGYLSEGSGGSFYLILWLFFWGLSVLGALLVNRRQGLQYSSAGIALEEIKSRERVALHAIDKHVELVEKKLRLTDDA